MSSTCTPCRRSCRGDDFFHTFELTMPRVPGRVIVEVDGVDGELHPEDNRRDCALGTQAPRDLRCRFVEFDDSEAFLLRWENAGVYDEILIYRDGSLAAKLRGTATSWTDSGAGLLSQPGLFEFHEYCVRARAGQSLSVKVVSECGKPPADLPFRRGDTNGDGTVNIADAVATLDTLFVGNGRFVCMDASDSNDDGAVDISDAINSLLVLFVGRGDIPAPGVEECGFDPTDDGVGCEQSVNCP